MHHRRRCVLRNSVQTSDYPHNVEFVAFMATVGASSAASFAQLSLLLVATCLHVPGVLTSGTSNVTSPLRFLVVCCGEAEQISELRHGGERG